jgi:hypothetical protein
MPILSLDRSLSSFTAAGSIALQASRSLGRRESMIQDPFLPRPESKHAVGTWRIDHIEDSLGTIRAFQRVVHAVHAGHTVSHTSAKEFSPRLEPASKDPLSAFNEYMYPQAVMSGRNPNRLDSMYCVDHKSNVAFESSGKSQAVQHAHCASNPSPSLTLAGFEHAPLSSSSFLEAPQRDVHPHLAPAQLASSSLPQSLYFTGFEPESSRSSFSWAHSTTSTCSYGATHRYASATYTHAAATQLPSPHRGTEHQYLAPTTHVLPPIKDIISRSYHSSKDPSERLYNTM